MPLDAKQLRFGPFQLDTRLGQLRKNGLGLKLQGQPVQILEILLERPGELVTREELRQRLWSTNTFVDFDHSLNAAMQRLRQALGDNASAPVHIETIPKRGYRFIGEVIQDLGDKSEAPAAFVFEEMAEKAAPNLGQSEPSHSQKSTLRWWQMVTVLGVGVFAGGATFYWATKPNPMPHILGSHVVTHTGHPKAWESWPRMGSLFFSEQTSSGPVTLRVPQEGGEAVQVSWLEGQLADISRDGAQFLSVTDEGVWTQSASGGSPRLIIKDHVWPFWTADARGIFLVRSHADATARFAELYRANADGTGVEHLASIPGVAFHPQLSPDGSRIRFSDLRGYRLWDIGIDGHNAHLVSPEVDNVFGAAWSPDGRFCFFIRGDNERFNLWWRAESGWFRKRRVSQQLTFGPVSLGPPSISSDGKKLFAMGVESQGELAVYDSKSRKFVPFLSGISAFFVDFSRDGKWITYVSYPEGILWRSRTDGSERRQLTSADMRVFDPRWSPDGKMIAFGTKVNGGADRIYLISSDGGSPLLLLAGEDVHEQPSWSPDGNSIAYGIKLSGVPKLSILDLRSQRSTVVPGSENLFGSRWSPDGKYLVALPAPWFNAKKLMLFSFATGKWEELASSDEDFAWMSWSSDSKYVFATKGSSMIRIAIANHRQELIGSFQGLRRAVYGTASGSYPWFGFTPEGRPFTTLDKGISEIYSFDLEYK